MKLRLFILTILILMTTPHYGQVIKKCDGSILRETSNKIGQLTQKEIGDFLWTFGKECRNNVEYSEWSNELLFALLDKQTELTIKTIEKEEKKIEIDVIFDELISPVNDAINVRNLIPKVDKLKTNERVKKEILARLKIADGKMN